MDPEVPLWCVVANVVNERKHGPAEEVRSGTKHFRGGAKVHVIDWFPGDTDAVMVVGQHRRSRRFIKIVTRAHVLENFRVQLVRSPSVLRLIAEHYAKASCPLSAPYAAEMRSALLHRTGQYDPYRSA